MASIDAKRIADAIDDTISVLEGIRKAYRGIEEADDLPDAFHKVHERVALAKEILNSAEEHTRNSSQDEKSYRALKVNVERSKQKAEKLRILFREVMPHDGTPRLERYHAAVQGLGAIENNTVETLMKEFLEDVHSLVKKCVVDKDGSVIIAVDEAQVRALIEAIEEFSTMPPSLKPDRSGSTFSNHGNGNLMVNTGRGKINNNTGDGVQFNGDTQNFGNEFTRRVQSGRGESSEGLG